MSEFQRASRAKRNLATALAPAAAYLLGAVAGEDGALEVEFGVLNLKSLATMSMTSRVGGAAVPVRSRMRLSRLLT